MAAWKTILAIDFDKWAARTYAANFPGVEVRHASVADELDRLPYADVIIGGPPCQPFSDAGDNEGEKDDRDGIPDFIEAVRLVRPRHFLMENVRGLLKQKHIAYFGRALTALEEAGYVVQWRLLDAVSYGVPQFRERVWVWGIRSGLHAAGMRHAWPLPTHTWPPPEGPCMFGAALLPGVTVDEALKISGVMSHTRDFQSTGAGSPFYPTDQPARTQAGIPRTLLVNTKQHRTLRTVLEPATTCGADDRRILIVPPRNGDPEIHAYRWSDAMLRKNPPASPASTIQAKYAKGGAEGLIAVAPWKCKGDLWVRRLTVLECSRLQSVSDDFVWPEGMKKTHGYRIVGNGQSCGTTKALSEAMRRVDPDALTIISLFCGGGLGDCGFHGRTWTLGSG